MSQTLAGSVQPDTMFYLASHLFSLHEKKGANISLKRKKRKKKEIISDDVFVGASHG